MKLSNNKGFTLVEILIGSVLIVMVAVTLFSALITTYDYLRYIMEMRTATLVLQEQVSETRDLSYSDIQSLGASFFSPEMVTLYNSTGTISQSSYNGSSAITKITFSLDWTAYNGLAKHMAIVTLMTEDGINKK